MMLINI